jgi:hypothetical protein
MGPFDDRLKDTPVFSEYLTFRRTGDSTILRWLLSFLSNGKKLDYQDADLNSTAFRGWKSTEERLSTLELDEEITSKLAVIVAAMLPPLREIPFMGRHGPGTVADGEKDILSKTEQLTFKPKLDRAFFPAYNVWRNRETLAHDIHAVIPDPHSWESARELYYSTANADRPSAELISEMRYAPKNVKTARTICREETPVMYFQQSVRWELEQRLHDGILGQYITIRDQSRNRELAAFGSSTSFLDTLDLQFASDSVSLDLVEKIFPQDILYLMKAVRSSTVKLPDGTKLKVLKFAPMGSAVCFVTQCVVFGAIVLLSQYEWLKRNGLWDKSITETFGDRASAQNFMRKCVPHQPIGWSKRRLNTMAVYGDDIICDYRISDDVIATLQSCGFLVNTEKSFRGTQAIRESCGGYYWEGHDVTPLLYRVKLFEPGGLNAKAFASIRDGANNAYTFGYLNYRKHLVQTLLWGKFEHVKDLRRAGEAHPILFVSRDKAEGIYSPNADNRHIPAVYHRESPNEENRWYQRDELRVLTVRAYLGDADRVEAYESALFLPYTPIQAHGYIQWARAGRQTGVQALSEIRESQLTVDVIEARIRRIWTPAY